MTKFVVNMLLRNPWSLEQDKVDSLPEEVMEAVLPFGWRMGCVMMAHEGEEIT